MVIKRDSPLWVVHLKKKLLFSPGLAKMDGMSIRLSFPSYWHAGNGLPSQMSHPPISIREHQNIEALKGFDTSHVPKCMSTIQIYIWQEMSTVSSCLGATRNEIVSFCRFHYLCCKVLYVKLRTSDATNFLKNWASNMLLCHRFCFKQL